MVLPLDTYEVGSLWKGAKVKLYRAVARAIKLLCEHIAASKVGNGDADVFPFVAIPTVDGECGYALGRVGEEREGEARSVGQIDSNILKRSDVGERGRNGRSNIIATTGGDIEVIGSVGQKACNGVGIGG